MIENTDYELVPCKNDDKAWNMRFLKGDYVETVVSIGTIKINEEVLDEKDDHTLSFDFQIVYSPDEDLTSEDTDLQDYVGKIILNVIEEQIKREDELSENRLDNSS